ncbi:MAG: AAA family ATPase, partial [Candidatus Ranarchaeia archaeon]
MVHIKKLELRGFKTFNEPITLVFSKGFNAIVGPNGSGKSNITDSINFVLGQLSSSSLRMNSIADVIFDPTMKTGGTETKQKPAKFARVVMTLDNSNKILPDPSKSVTIFRQVDKTGTSIYKINGKRVTRSELRDFLSFAYLSADGYNIIPQGKISTLIGMTYEQRRQLIEEIAGIQTYDQKKERAKKELAKADINLRQINILVKQNEKTLENLVNEKEKAVKFNEIDTKKRNLESQIYKFELKNSKESIKKFERRIREANKIIQASMGKQEAESTILQKYKNEENSLSDELEEWREKQLKNEKEIGGVEGILSSMSAEIQLLETMIQTNQSSNKKDTKTLSQKKNQMGESKARVKELKEEQRGIQERLKEKQVESESQRNNLLSLEHERKSHLNVLKDAQKNFQSINDSHHSVLTKLESEITRNEEIQRNLDSDTQIVNSYNSKIIEAKDQIKEIKNEISINNKRKGKLESRRKNQEKQKRNTHDELEKILESIKKTHDKKLKLETRINAFEEIKEDEEDGGKALNYLKELKRKDLLEGSIGIFSDFVTLDEKKRNSVKTASNGLFNSFIVSNKASLDLCLNALNRKPIGRARFIVLENIKSEIENQPSELEKIKDLVEVPDSLNKVNSFIFQDAYFSPTLDEAWEKRNQYKTIVTESGELIYNGASIEGGLPLDLRNVIDEDKKQLNEIEKEEERLSNLQSQLIKSSNDQEKLLQLTNGELNSTTDSLRNSQFKIQSLNSQIDSWDFELRNINNKIKRDKSLVAEVDAQIL